MRTHILAFAALGVLAAGCTSQGGTPPTISVPPPQTAPQVSQASAVSNAPEAAAVLSPNGASNKNDFAGINAVNALGSPVKTYGDESGSSQTNSSIKSAIDTRSGNGTCRSGVEFFSPDRKGDPNSTETLDFFNSTCTELARDVVRLWTPGATAGSETVNRTASNYALGHPNYPIAVRTSQTGYTNATFTKNGYPIVSDGFIRETSSNLTIGTTKSVISDDEDVMLASSSNVSNYCTDSAGYSWIGDLTKSFGWQGGAFTGGTRTQNADGSVTWAATHTGQAEYGALGGLSIATGTTNSACPITSPAYTLNGGTVKGNYTIPVTVTINDGEVINLTVSNGQLANGDVLTVTTNTNKNPSHTGFINGTVTNGTRTIAIFDVNGFGSGRLTIASNGHQFPINDWTVVR